MKTCAIVVCRAALAVPASAGIIHDESVDGNLRVTTRLRRPLALSWNGNTVIGTTTSGNPDYLRFTIGTNQVLSALNLLVYSPDNLSLPRSTPA